MYDDAIIIYIWSLNIHFAFCVCSAGAVSGSQADFLETSIGNRDKSVVEAFTKYEEDHDVYKLIGTLRSYAVTSMATMATATSSPVKQSSPEKQSTEENAEESVEEMSIEQKFLQIVQTMSLSSVETAALRLAIARGDSEIRSALEDFKNTQNEEVLVDTLRKIARGVIVQTMSDQEKEENPSQQSSTEDKDFESDNSEDEVESVESSDDELDEEVKRNTLSNSSPSKSPLKSNDSQSEGSGGLATQAAREQIVPILLNELSKENILNKSDCEKLFNMFQNNNVVLAAALDVYDLDNDMSELVDTLHRIAKLN